MYRCNGMIRSDNPPAAPVPVRQWYTGCGWCCLIHPTSPPTKPAPHGGTRARGIADVADAAIHLPRQATYRLQPSPAIVAELSPRFWIVAPLAYPKPDIVCRSVDGQPGDAVVDPSRTPMKLVLEFAHGNKSCTAVPGGGGRGIDIPAENAPPRLVDIAWRLFRDAFTSIQAKRPPRPGR